MDVGGRVKRSSVNSFFLLGLSLGSLSLSLSPYVWLAPVDRYAVYKGSFASAWM